MAVNDIVSVTTNTRTVPAIVLEQYDADGEVTATDGDVVEALLYLLGGAGSGGNAQRRLAKDASAPYAVNTFTFTGSNS